MNLKRLPILAFALGVAFSLPVGAEPQRLAILVGSPWGRESAMQNDVEAMKIALRARGYAASEVMSLIGHLDRSQLTGFLERARARISTWEDGEVFLYVSGHGTFDGGTPETARVAVRLASQSVASDESTMYWDEIFSTLAVPAGLRFVLLPDT